MKTLYEILGVPKDADEATLKQARRKLAKIHHPDREGGDEVTMRAINEAYEVLIDAERRKVYDETGESEALVSDDLKARQEAATIVMRVLEENPLSTNPLEHAREVVRSAMQEAEKRRRAAQRRVDALGKQLNRFKLQKGENLIQAAIIDQRNDLQREIREHTQNRAAMDQTLAALDAYEYEAPIPETPIWQGSYGSAAPAASLQLPQWTSGREHFS